VLLPQVGLPKNIQVLYVDQLEGVDGDAAVVDIVVASDTQTTRLRGEVDILQRALEEGTDDVEAGLLEVRVKAGVRMCTRRDRMEMLF
jgi:ATPase subunit of ABC transporter with duplicated ATPase domains